MSELKELTTIPTSDLIKELVCRCSPAVFIGYKNEGEDGMNTFFNYSGHQAVCYGLCHQMAHSILVDEIRQIKEE